MDRVKQSQKKGANPRLVDNDNTVQTHVCSVYDLADNSILDDKLWPYLPEGDYQVMFIGHETRITFSVPKVYTHFKIVDTGPHYGKVIYRAFNAKSLSGKSGKNGKFKLQKRSELYLTLCRFYESTGKLFRPDRVSLAGLKNMVIQVSVRTVTKDYRQRKLPECCRYSVIGELKYIVAGSDT